jgi:hypothetical protein
MYCPLPNSMRQDMIKYILAVLLLLSPASGWGWQLIGSQAVVAAVYKINFQPTGSAVPDGYTLDDGSGYTSGMGWAYVDSGNPTATGETRDREINSDQRYDTLITIYGAEFKWEYSLDNGTYSVKVVTGDAGNPCTGTYTQVEGVTFHDNVSTSANQFSEITHDVTVSDGKLTMTFIGNTVTTKVNFIEITRQ